MTIAKEITDLGSAIAAYIGAGENTAERFREVHDAIEKVRTLQVTLRNVEAERLLSGLDAPRVTVAMRDALLASGADGAKNRDDLFYALTDSLMERGIQLASQSAPVAGDSADFRDASAA